MNKEAKLLRIFVGESDKFGHHSLYEEIIFLAKNEGLSGATAYKGILGFGASSKIHTSKILSLSEDLPIIIEIADSEEKINSFIPKIKELFEKSGNGGMITVERAEIILYKTGKFE